MLSDKTKMQMIFINQYCRFIPLNLEIVILLSYVFVLLPIYYLNARSSSLLFSITSIHNSNRF